jgi:hypothetical protein
MSMSRASCGSTTQSRHQGQEAILYAFDRTIEQCVHTQDPRFPIDIYSTSTTGRSSAFVNVSVGSIFNWRYSPRLYGQLST